MPVFKTIHTTYGLRRMAEAEALGKPINLTAMAVGDGAGNDVFPDPSQTHLVREIAASRAAPNRVYPDVSDPTMFTAELIIPASVNGFTMREVGIFDEDGGLFAVGNLPATYKPNVEDGSYSDAVVRLKFAVTNTSVVTIMMDTNVAVATQAWIIHNVTPALLFPGGTTGQVLRKRSNADGDASWEDPSAVNVLVNTVEEEQTLAADQVTINLALTTTVGLAVYIEGVRLPNKAGVDGWQPHASIVTRLTLGKSYPAGQKVICVQNEPNSKLVDPLAKSLNLSDVPDKEAARANLGVLSVAQTKNMAPVGLLAYFVGIHAPPGWLKANGGAIGRVAYPELYATIGTTFGAGDGFNTFNLPDLRGEFLRGLDDGRGVDANRVLGSAQASAFASHGHAAAADSQGLHSHSARTDTQGAHKHAGSAVAAGMHQHDSGWGERDYAPYGVARTGVYGSNDSDWDNQSYLTSAAGEHKHTLDISAAGEHAHAVAVESAGAHAHNISVAATGGNETRPRNVAMLTCIKY